MFWVARNHRNRSCDPRPIYWKFERGLYLAARSPSALQLRPQPTNLAHGY